MELVGSGAGNDVDYTAGRTASLCSVAVCLDGDLLNSLDVGLDSDGADNTFVVVDSIDNPVVERIVLSIDGETRGVGAAIIGASSTAESVAGTFVGARNKLYELNKVTAVPVSSRPSEVSSAAARSYAETASASRPAEP